MSEDDYSQYLAQTAITGMPLSLYVHIPFCDTICFYCACNKIATKNVEKAAVYLQYLCREIDLVLAIVGRHYPVAQLHLGGGTPLFLSDDQLFCLIEKLRTGFDFNVDGEYSIEIDPRDISTERIRYLSVLGFNRISVGIQDFDPHVQKAVNRLQSVEETDRVIHAARQYHFRSISVDLIYGLPYQTVESVHYTLEQVLSMSPDRIALYNYAHLPGHFMPQRRIDEHSLPTSEKKLDILQHAVQFIIENGYVFIGMDHFSKPDDELSKALTEGRLQRNFQGYSTHSECNMIGFGVSSIGFAANAYVQNYKDLVQYYAALDDGHLPISRGYQLNQDDLLRRQIIQQLMCRFTLSVKEIEDCHSIIFSEYFALEMSELYALQNDGLLTFDGVRLIVSGKGRYLIRNIAMVFDRYLREKASSVHYSKTI